MAKVRRVKATGNDLLQLLDIPGVEKAPMINETNAKNIETFPYIYSIVDVYGRVWAITGAYEYEQGRHEAFMLIDPEAKIHALTITRLIKEQLDEYPFDVESFVQTHLEKAHKHNLVLGFKLKTPDIVQNREGQNCALYIYSKKG